MIFLWPQATSMVTMPIGFGVMTAPATNMVAHGIREGRPWAMDNGAFTGGFKPTAFFDFLRRHEPYRDTCLFVVVPDVVGNAIATLENYRQWVRHYEGWPVAFVAQDGQEHLALPNYYDWLFIGGSTEWKLGDGAVECIRRARAVGKPVHVGRVNSQRRFNRFLLQGVTSCDGTNPIYEPDRARARWPGIVAQRPLLDALPAGYRAG